VYISNEFFSLTYLKRVVIHFILPRFSYLRWTRMKDIPVRLFLVNMVITAIYTIGVLSALYAALLVPENRTTALMASGLINGMATILLVVFVDPKVSVVA